MPLVQDMILLVEESLWKGLAMRRRGHVSWRFK